jgi:hypothetical protein
MNEKQHGITGVRALLRLLTRFLYAKNLVAVARELGVTPALPARRRPSFAKKFLILIGFRG